MTCTIEAVLICDVEIDEEKLSEKLADTQRQQPEWLIGPYVYTYNGPDGRTVQTDVDARSTNFPPQLSALLFGPLGSSQSQRPETAGSARTRATQRHPVRYNSGQGPLFPSEDSISSILQVASVSSESTEIAISHADLLLAAATPVDASTARAAVLSLHLSITARNLDEALSVVSAMSHSRGKRNEGFGRGRLGQDMVKSIDSLRSVCKFPTGSDAAEGSIYTLTLNSRTSDSGDWAVDDEELYRCAALQTTEKAHSARARIEEATKNKRSISKSWSMLALRHGASFQLHSPEEDDFRQFAPVYFHTLYTDAYMLARLQTQLLRSWERPAHSILSGTVGSDDLSSARDQMMRLERAVAVDSARYWLKKTEANTGKSISILHDAQDAQQVSQRLASLETQIATLARLAERDATNRRTKSQETLSAIAMVLAVAVFPITIANDLVSLFGIKLPSLVLVLILIVLAGVLGVCAIVARRLLLKRR